MGEDEVVASEAANEDVMSGWGWGGSVGRGMVHLLLSPLGRHNHLPGSHFSLIQPLTRAGREGERREGVRGRAPCVLLFLSQLNERVTATHVANKPMISI